MVAVLSEHVQHFEVICWLGMELEQNILSIKCEQVEVS